MFLVCVCGDMTKIPMFMSLLPVQLVHHRLTSLSSVIAARLRCNALIILIPLLELRLGGVDSELMWNIRVLFHELAVAADDDFGQI